MSSLEILLAAIRAIAAVYEIQAMFAAWCLVSLAGLLVYIIQYTRRADSPFRSIRRTAPDMAKMGAIMLVALMGGVIALLTA